MSSKLLITFPGKLGDCVWAMASMKELAGDGQVDVALSVFCRNLVPVLWSQPWVSDVFVLEDWRIFPGAPAPIQPLIPPTMPEGYDKVIHLGLPDWPKSPLGAEFGRLTGVVPNGDPWLIPPGSVGSAPERVHPAIAFTDEWAELKVGLICALNRHLPVHPTLLLCRGSRLATDFSYPPSMRRAAVDIKELTAWIGQCLYLITDKSLPRVLAYGMGVPTYVVEPAEARHNPIFDPPEGWHKDAGMLNGSNSREMMQMIERGQE